MNNKQREQNPDVNSYSPDADPAERPSTGSSNGNRNVERGEREQVIPVPPDSHPGAPVEEPPARDEVPVGDVDDSPKRIA